MIAAGTPSRRWAPTPILKLPPVQYVGDVSYSLYLWHWPLLIFAPFVVDRSLHPEAGVVILALALLAAGLSKVLVEDPVRAGSFLTARGGRWTFAAAAAGTGVVLVVAAGAMSHMRGEVAAAERASQQILASNPKCFGAAARDPRKPCSNRRLRYKVVPTPIAARRAPNHPCKVIERHDDIQVCEFGVPKEKAKDSDRGDRGQPRLALAAVARLRGAQEGLAGVQRHPHELPVLQGRAGHPRADALRVPALEGRRAQVVLAPPRGDATSSPPSSPAGRASAPSRRDKFGAEVDGYLKAWKTLPATVKRITVIRDTPKMRGDTDTCVQQAISAHRRAGPACALPRSDALDRDAAVAAAQRHPPRVRYVNLTRFFCDSSRCFPVIGGALVYKDATHITSVYGRTLGPYLLRALG